MGEKQSEEFTLNSFRVIAFFERWWKTLIIVSAAGFICSAGISLLIKDLYRSTVIFYPATTNSVSKALLERWDKNDFLSFGEEEDAEYALQILQSSQIRDFIIQKYDLYKHYDIDPTSKYARTKLYKKYSARVNFRRTEYNSVEISVLDEDPQTAANMANDIAAQMDTVKNRIQTQRARDGVKIVEEKYFILQKEVELMNDTLDKIRALGINDYVTQAEAMNTEYAVALAKGNEKGAKAIEEKLALLSKYGGKYVELTHNLDIHRGMLIDMKRKYEQALADAESQISHKMIVDYAYPADRKTYPKRSYIVLISTFGSFCLAVFILIGIENFRAYRQSSRTIKEA